MEKKVVSIINEMSEFLSIGQLRVLQETMLKHLCETGPDREQNPNEDYLQLFFRLKANRGMF